MNCDLFIDSYLSRISESFKISIDESFEVFSISTILDRSFDEVYEDTIINGKNDGGIDGIYFSEDYGNITMHVFHCKNSKNLKQNEIDKFRNDYKDLFIDGNRVNRMNIEGLKSKIDQFRSLITTGKVIDTVLYFVYNGNTNDPKISTNKKLVDNFNIPGEFEIWDSRDIYQKISNLVKSLNKRKKVEFTFKPENSNITSSKDNQGLISFSIYQVKAAIFRIKAIQLCLLLEEEKRINETFEKIFSENIRGFLGVKNLTNEKIIETINGNNNVYFPFLNNGITIICDEFILPYNPQLGEYNLPTVNPVIVNGLQTTYLLYQEYLKNEKQIEDIYVTIRLYQTDDPILVEQITDATNTQSSIGFKDKISNKKFNIYAKELFENNGIGYITKRGEVFISNTNPLIKKTVQNTTILPLWYASFCEQPHTALVAPMLMFKEIFEATNKPDHPYFSILKGDIDSPLYSQLFLVYAISEIFNKEYKAIEHTVDDYLAQKFELLKGLGKEYLTYFIYKLIEDDLDDVSNNQIISAIYELADVINYNGINTAEHQNKSSVVSLVVSIKSTSEDFRKTQRELKSESQYIELLDGRTNSKEISEVISSKFIQLENLKIIEQ